jgi:hypothetical protein
VKPDAEKLWRNTYTCGVEMYEYLSEIKSGSDCNFQFLLLINILLYILSVQIVHKSQVGQYVTEHG